MAGRSPQTQAKRAREVALREKRERKEAKKADRRAAAASGLEHGEDVEPLIGADGEPVIDENGEPVMVAKPVAESDAPADEA